MGKALKIRAALSAEGLRGEARREKDGRAAARMYAIAHALDGLSRAEAARLAGMERQALRGEADQNTIQWIVFPANVVRSNAEGLAGLHDRPKGRPRRRLDANEEAALVAAIERGPNPTWTPVAPGRGPTSAAGWRPSTARPTTRRA